MMRFKRLEIWNDSDSGLLFVTYYNVLIKTDNDGFGASWLAYDGNELLLGQLDTFDDGPVSIFNTNYMCVTGRIGENYGEWRLFAEL